VRGRIITALRLGFVQPIGTLPVNGIAVPIAEEKVSRKKRCQEPFSRFLGRPWGRSVLSSPSRRTIWSHQAPSPNGLPRCTQRRSAANSASVCGPLTCSTQPGQRGKGQAANNDFSFAVP
jgi:hypothetical protein